MAVVARTVDRPVTFSQFCAGKPEWIKPALRIEWVMRWVAYVLAQWALLEVLEYIGSFSILAAVILYFAGTHDRIVQKHYQAWQVINTAQGNTGAGGRIDAMQDLNQDGVSLVGVDVKDAFLENVQLPRAELRRALLSGADLRDANLNAANLEDAILISTNLVRARLAGVNFARAKLTGADLTDADLAGIVNWMSIKDISGATVANVKNPPEGFVAWAVKNGATTQPTAD